MNPISKWLNNFIFGHRFYFAGISASAVAAGVSAAATAAGAASSLMGGSEGSSAAGAAGDNASGISKEQMYQAKLARDAANKYQMPYYNTGTAAQNKLAYLYGLGGGVSEMPTDTSYRAFNTLMKDRLKQHMAGKPKLSKKPTKDEKAALEKWQSTKTWLTAQSKAPNDSEQYRAWIDRQKPTTKTQTPVGGDYGSLLKDFTEQDFRVDPGYQFRKDQGNREIQNRLASMGMSGSGSAVKEAANYNQGVADQAYQGAWDRFMQQKQFKTNALSNFAGAGQRAADNISNNENTYGANVTQSLANKGQAQQNAIYEGANSRIAGYTGAANAIGGGAKNLVDLYGYSKGMGANSLYDASAWGG